jgi:hypothetical protein
MRAKSRLLKPLFLAAGLAALVPAIGSAQGPMPHRKPGMWQTTINMPGMPGGGISTSMCTDAATEARYSALAPQQNPGSQCSKMTVHSVPGGWDTEGECVMRGKTSHFKASARGDMSSAYGMDVSMQEEGRPAQTMHMDAKWTGPCPAGRKPGDMVMPGGVVMNMTAPAGP